MGYPTATIPNGWQIAGQGLTGLSGDITDFSDKQQKLRALFDDMQAKKAQADLEAQRLNDEHAAAALSLNEKKDEIQKEDAANARIGDLAANGVKVPGSTVPGTPASVEAITGPWAKPNAPAQSPQAYGPQNQDGIAGLPTKDIYTPGTPDTKSPDTYRPATSQDYALAANNTSVEKAKILGQNTSTAGVQAVAAAIRSARANGVKNFKGSDLDAIALAADPYALENKQYLNLRKTFSTDDQAAKLEVSQQTANANDVKASAAMKNAEKPSGFGQAAQPATPDLIESVAQKIAHHQYDAQTAYQAFSGIRGPNRGAGFDAAVTRAAEIDPSVNIAQMKIGFKQAENVQNQRTLALINSVEPNLTHLLEISDKISRMPVQSISSMQLHADRQFSDSDLAAFDALKTLSVDEINNIFSGTGGSDKSRDMAISLINEKLPPKQFASTMHVIVDAMKNRENAIRGSMDQYAPADPNSGTSTVKSSSGKTSITFH